MTSNPRERWLLDQVAAGHQRRAGESWAHYIERLTLLAGLLDRADAVLVKPDEELDSRESKPERPRLPFKDD